MQPPSRLPSGALELRTSLEILYKSARAGKSLQAARWLGTQQIMIVDMLHRLSMTLPIYKKSVKRKGMVEKMVMRSDLLGA